MELPQLHRIAFAKADVKLSSYRPGQTLGVPGN
jgi:hypothetical protein